MSGSEYSAADIYAMQKEAEQRVFEMQRRARRTLEDQDDEQKPTRHEGQHNENEQKAPAKSGGIERLLELLGGDKEKALIALVLIILLKENVNEPIIFVLAYLLIDF